MTKRCSIFSFWHTTYRLPDEEGRVLSLSYTKMLSMKKEADTGPWHTYVWLAAVLSVPVIMVFSSLDTALILWPEGLFLWWIPGRFCWEQWKNHGSHRHACLGQRKTKGRTRAQWWGTGLGAGRGVWVSLWSACLATMRMGVEPQNPMWEAWHMLVIPALREGQSSGACRPASLASLISPRSQWGNLFQKQNKQNSPNKVDDP